jgi:hypothetical protein
VHAGWGLLDLYGVAEQVVEEVRRAGSGGVQMIEVQIGDIRKHLRDVQPSWINEQLARRRRDGDPVCVQVFIDKPQVRMRLASPDCLGIAGGRAATSGEQEIFELWEKHQLNDANFTGGNLIAFLRQIS